MTINKAKAKQYPEAELLLLENHSYSSSTLSSKKIIGDIFKNAQKRRKSVGSSIHEKVKQHWGWVK